MNLETVFNQKKTLLNKANYKSNEVQLLQ